MDNVFNFFKIFIALLSIFINILALKKMRRTKLLHRKILEDNRKLF